MQKLREKYKEVAVPELKKQFQKGNVHSIPNLTKVTLNIGLSAKRDPKFVDVITETLKKISGQKPIVTKARKSIAGFKVREGQVVGATVTLRGARMWDFMDKLVNVSFARIRDFRGIPETAVDVHGNFNYGFREHLSFPEIPPEEIDVVHGLQVTITTTAESKDKGMALFRLLGFPFKKSDT